MRSNPLFTRKTWPQPSSVAHVVRSIATAITLLVLVSACGTNTAPSDDGEIVLEYAQTRAQEGDLGSANDNRRRLDGSTVSGTISISVRVSGPTDEIRIYADDHDQRQQPVLVATEKPFVMELDTKTLTDGRHSFTVTTRSQSAAEKATSAAFHVVNTLSSPVVSESAP